MNAGSVEAGPCPTLSFSGGTLELRGVSEADAEDLPAEFVFDGRSNCFRAPAYRYADVVMSLHGKRAYQDEARRYLVLEGGPRVSREPRPFQVEALQAWATNRGRGVVVLPTGAGKSHLAVMAIAHQRRATLVIVPTLDLVRQWYDLLRTTFPWPVGVVGGGEHRVEPLTVTTYDSAYLHMDHLGNRFGVVVFDECHHLPSEAYALAAQQCMAPYRLGLSATPERADGKEALLTDLVGPFVYRKEITELSGEYLADYDIRTLTVHLTEAEREEYERQRAVYTGFIRQQGIRMGSPQGFNEFIMRSGASEAGRQAMRAYRRQKELAVAASVKLDVLQGLLTQHRSDRVLVFTQDNATAYTVARRFLIPVITHQTKVTERSEILERLAKGEVNAVVTSKVLNEGVDVPAANVAVVISGSGSVREHVQRLGRILRLHDGKRAELYEIVSAGTAETATSERRRDHEAYR